jgi:hypothetical protein
MKGCCHGDCTTPFVIHSTLLPPQSWVHCSPCFKGPSNYQDNVSFNMELDLVCCLQTRIGEQTSSTISETGSSLCCHGCVRLRWGSPAPSLFRNNRIGWRQTHAPARWRSDKLSLRNSAHEHHLIMPTLQLHAKNFTGGYNFYQEDQHL